MKICLINNLYAPYARGGAEAVIKAVARDLLDLGHDVFVIATAPDVSAVGASEAVPRAYFVPGIYYNLSKLPKLLRFFWHLFDIFDVRTGWRVARILKKEKPSLVVTNNLTGLSFLIPRVINKLGLRHAHVLHDIQLLHPSGLMLFGKEKMVDSIIAKFYQKISSFLFRDIKIVISPSRWLLRTHLERGFFKYSRQKTMLNPIGFRTKTETAPRLHKLFVFLFVGQLEKHKGIGLLLDAFQVFCEKEKSPSELRIIGNGQEQSKVEQAAGQNAKIIFKGVLRGEEVENEMRGSDCLVVPSLCYENSPTVILEAITVGLPVIASKLGGIPELIERFGGIVFAPGSKDDLADTMRQVIKNPAAMTGTAGLNSAKIEAQASEYGRSLLELCGLDNS